MRSNPADDSDRGRAAEAVSATELVIDDRLATVMSLPVEAPAAARIQYRQLLDLLGRMPPHFALPDAALARLETLDRTLPAAERSAILRAAPASLRHPALILRLAAQEPPVAAAAITAARLDDWQWSALIAELPLAARGHLRHRRDLGPRALAMLARFGIVDLGLPRPAVIELDQVVPEPSSGEGIGAIVKRIEAFRKSRQAGSRQFGEGSAGEAGTDAPRLPLADEPRGAARATAIRFDTDARGRIVSADAALAPMLVGLALGARDEAAPARCDARSSLAFRRRHPVRGGRVEIAGAAAVAGAWRIDAAPRFAPDGGRYLGHHGVLRRPAIDNEIAREGPADRLRQLLHELRTPINAIQGFAELIQQQLFGPTPHQYRSLAASIAADSAAVLAGFDDIERLVKLESGRSEEAAPGHADLAALVHRLIAQLEPSTAARDVRIAFDARGPAPVAMAEADAERTIWRLLATLAAAASPGERVAIELSAGRGGIELAAALPAQLAERDADALFAVEPAAAGSPLALSLLGGGFALRLARAEARAAGGSLHAAAGRLSLRLPGLTPSADPHSADGRASADRATRA